MMDYDRLYEQLDAKIKYISDDEEAEWIDVGLLLITKVKTESEE